MENQLNKCGLIVLTQEELARHLSTRQTIIAIENNKYCPSLKLALKIARFFETHVEEIFKLISY